MVKNVPRTHKPSHSPVLRHNRLEGRFLEEIRAINPNHCLRISCVCWLSLELRIVFCKIGDLLLDIHCIASDLRKPALRRLARVDSQLILIFADSWAGLQMMIGWLPIYNLDT